LIRAFALVVKLYVVHSFFVEYLEEVPHRGSTKCGEGLAAYRDDEAGVLMAKLYESREDTESLSATTSALMDLNPGLRFLDVVICCREFTQSESMNWSWFSNATQLSPFLYFFAL
jgi:hypothetical protein